MVVFDFALSIFLGGDGDYPEHMLLANPVLAGKKPKKINKVRCTGHGEIAKFNSNLNEWECAAQPPDPPCFRDAFIPSSEGRYFFCGNGTVTGLIMLENANCFGRQSWATARRVEREAVPPPRNR